MKILDIRIRCNFSIGNNPEICILVDKIPSGHRWKEKKITDKLIFYYRELNGVVEFLYEDKDSMNGGYYNMITLENGKELEIMGAWKSNPARLKAATGVATSEIYLYTNIETWKSGKGGCYFTAMSVDKLSKLLGKMGLHLKLENSFGS